MFIQFLSACVATTRMCAGRIARPGFVVTTTVAAMAASVIAVGPAVGTARAATCPEDGIFWSMLSGGTRVLAFGSRQQITLSSQTLKCVTAADGQAGTGQTSRILLGGQANNWVEVGALTQYCPSGSQCNRAFFEYAVVGTYNYQQRYAFSCLNPGTRHTWSIERKQLGGTWAGYLSCYTSQPFVQVDSTTPNLGYNTGFAEGEGFERGFSNTYWGDEAPMAETHSVMQYQNAYQGAWLASGDLSCRLDDSLRWDGSWLASDSFQIVENHRGTGC